MSALFTPITFRNVTLRNRIVVSPMCQYVAEDGVLNDWHRTHYASLARGGAGLVIIEATSINPTGRISPGDSGLWNDAQAEVLAGIAFSIKAAGAVPGIQLAHAGRKASANRPWEGDDHFPDGDPRGWETVAPSAIALGGILPKVPRAISLAEIEQVQADYVASAKRALAAGFEFLQLHFAHGYLAASFLNENSNQRSDRYGGNLENRGRFLVETIVKIREVWPDNLPLSVKLGVIEFDGHDVETVSNAIEVARAFKDLGVDQLDLSMGFTTVDVNIPWGTPAFMLPTAERFKQHIDLPLSASWGLDVPEIAENAVSEGPLDIVMVGRAHLANPFWTYHAARKLGVEHPSRALPMPYGHWLERYAVDS